jgi:putative Mn2+ efflux pump MntP
MTDNLTNFLWDLAVLVGWGIELLITGFVINQYNQLASLVCIICGVICISQFIYEAKDPPVG